MMNELYYYFWIFFLTMYFEVQIIVICNNYEYDVGMNYNVKFVKI